MSPAIPSDTRPLIDRLREAVPGLSWQWEGGRKEVHGHSPRQPYPSIPAVCVSYSVDALECWLDSAVEPHAVELPRPSDDEVVRIVRDWYDKTHPAKSILERTKELIREAVPGVEITEQSSRDGIYLHCTIGSELGTWSVYQPAGMTGETFERTKDKLAEAARKALVKPTNTQPGWTNYVRDTLNRNTPDSWLASEQDGVWQVASEKNGQRIVVTVERVSGVYRVEVREGAGVLPYREKTAGELFDLVQTLCKARADLGIPEEAQKFAREMRDAGFEVITTSLAEDCAAVVVRSVATGKALRLTYGTVIGWGIDGAGFGYTTAQVSTRVRTELTKPQPEYRGIQDLRDELVAEILALGEVPLSSNDRVLIEFRNYSVESTNKHIVRNANSIKTLAREMVDSIVAERKKMLSAEHEAFEKKAREATTQYLQNAGMSLTVPVTAKQRCESLANVLADDGVIAIIEPIDDHCAVCVTDPSTGEVHKVICDPAGKWLMDGEEVYGLVAATELKELAQRQAKGRTKMRTTRRQRIEQGVYLGAVKAAGDQAKEMLVQALASGLPASDQESARAVLAKVLDTELGAGFLFFGMGEAAELVADQFEGGSPKVEAFAEAIQVVGAMRGANAAIEALIVPIKAAIAGLAEAIPEPPKMRAEPDAPAAEEHEEPAHTGRKARAQR